MQKKQMNNSKAVKSLKINAKTQATKNNYKFQEQNQIKVQSC